MKIVILLFSALLWIGIPTSAAAHELIPQEVQDYIEQNPDATPVEIEQFVQGSAPELAEKAGNATELVALVKDRDTSFLDNMYDFLRLGVEHILSGPDHILFVLTLLLVFTSLKDVLRLTLAFTAAHSLTLLLAGANILTLSATIVEPIIAFSIAFMAIISVFYRNHRILGHPVSRAGIVFFFGLFHGLGFAGLLREINVPDDKFVSSLLSFNAGIEVGQLLIIALALPIVYAFRDTRWYATAVKVSASVIATIGVFWGAQRLLSG